MSDWGPRNSKSDIFSLGCVILEILFALHEELVPPNPSKPYHESLEDGQLRLSLKGFSRLGRITSDMLRPRPKHRPSAEVITSNLRHDKTDRFCAKCKVEKGIENRDDCNVSPKSMRWRYFPYTIETTFLGSSDGSTAARRSGMPLDTDSSRS